jgi:polyhydroxyalkanoate synthase
VITEMTRRLNEAAEKMMKGDVKPSLPFDPLAIAKATSEFAMGLAMKPTDLMEVQMVAARQWGDFWTSTLSGKAGEKPRDRRFAAPEWQDDAYYRAIRDAYLLASQQLRDVVSLGEGNESGNAMVRFLLDQYLNAISPANFAATNPEVVQRTKETNCANLVQGFANLVEDVASGKGIVQRRTDPNAFEKGKTIAATPGEVVFQNDLFQLIQYTPSTAKVAAEPLLYVPPLVNRYYLIDLVPRQSLVAQVDDTTRRRTP